jgi:hypothetical protein
MKFRILAKEMPMDEEQIRGNPLERSRELGAWSRTVGADTVSELILHLANTWAAIEKADDLLRQMVRDKSHQSAREYLVELDTRLFDELQVHMNALSLPLKALIDQMYGD